MKVSVISTVKNEERNIKKFVDSLLNQTKKPDEIIIVDGGSTDKTYQILKKYAEKNKEIKLSRENGANIAKGRNIAISKSKNTLIIGGDAGTKYKYDWIEKLVNGFEGGVAYGQTLPLIENSFQKILAKKMRQRYGSSRNIIFEKRVWKKVRGYPEDLRMAEDTVFNERIKRAGFKINLIPEAIGYWEMRENIEGLRKQFFNYGYWDAIAYKKYKILPGKSKILILLLTILFPFYPIAWLISKFSLSFNVDVTRRFSYLNGFWRGIFR
jgi:glycosyltransferase involved in cell wall biosynthesis